MYDVRAVGKVSTVTYMADILSGEVTIDTLLLLIEYTSEHYVLCPPVTFLVTACLVCVDDAGGLEVCMRSHDTRFIS